MLGPLLGAAVLAVSDWRAIFWLNLLLGVGLAAGVASGARRRPDPVGLVLVALAAGAVALLLAEPAALAEDVTVGLLWVPLVGVLDDDHAAGRRSRARRSRGRGARADPPGRRRPAAPGHAPARRGRRRARLAARRRVPGRVRLGVRRRRPGHAGGRARLAAAAASPPSRRERSSIHERRAAAPVLPLAALRPTGAWGALLVNLFVGVALVAALVDVPLFARATTTPGDQLGAALVLLRLLIAVPVGAVAGGWLCRAGAATGSRRRRDGARRRLLRRDDRLGRAVAGRAGVDGRPGRRRTGLRPGDRPGQRRPARGHPVGGARQRRARWPWWPARSACWSGCRC